MERGEAVEKNSLSSFGPADASMHFLIDNLTLRRSHVICVKVANNDAKVLSWFNL